MKSHRPIRIVAAVLFAALTGALLATVLGCGISVNDDKKAQKVDIQTPLGSLKVNTQIDPKEIGLPIYPGARQVSDEGDHDDSSANVNISSAMFAVKVVAAKFQTDDPPDKVLQFYRKQLGSMGKMIECPNGVDADVKGDDQSQWKQEVVCRSSPEPGRAAGEVDLAVGTRDHHHIVNLKPADKGCRFNLVYVETHGQRQTM